MSSEGPLFPKKSQHGEQDAEAPPLEIERSDDPDFGKRTRRGPAGLPTMPGKKVGCSSGVFLLMVGIGMVGMVAVRVAPHGTKVTVLAKRSPAGTGDRERH